MNKTEMIFLNAKLWPMGLMLIFLMLFSGASRATYVTSAEAVVGFDSAPFDGQVFLVPESNPFYTVNAVGWGFSTVDWVMGSESDILLYGWEPGDQDLLLYGWRIIIDGIGTLHTGHTIIGGGYTEQRETANFFTPTFSEMATVGLGTHFVQIEHTVYLTTLEIVATDVLTHSFYVEAVKTPEPGTLSMFALGLAGIGCRMRRRSHMHSVVHSFT